MPDEAFDLREWSKGYQQEHPELKEFRVHPERDDWRLDTIIVHRECRKAGIGSAALRDLARIADQHGKRLIVSVAQRDEHHGTTSRARLVGFYKRFGFVENAGRNKDFTITAGMYRAPQPVPVARKTRGISL